jgi:hypothetical protein
VQTGSAPRGDVCVPWSVLLEKDGHCIEIIGLNGLRPAARSFIRIWQIFATGL